MLSKPVATAPPTVLQRFLVCVFYGATSGALSLLMKKLLSRYSFSGFFLLLAAQMGLQLGLCILSRDRMGNPFGVPEYDRSTHQASLRLGVTGVGNVAVGMLGLQLVNIPMFLCIRRLVAPFILMYEALVFGKFASMPINTAVCGILLGTLVAGYETLSSDMLGYMVVVVNNVLSAAVSVQAEERGALTPVHARTPAAHLRAPGLTPCTLLPRPTPQTAPPPLSPLSPDLCHAEAALL